MSKYTTEVRYLCEYEAGYDESQGYQSVDNIVTLASPKIFDFDFPIFDENYRLILEKRILKHYYTREICEETYGLWKLRLEDRMNLIMPYFNKLYESELLQFNPLYDTDYSVDHEGDATDTVAETNGNTRTMNLDTKTDYDETNSNTRTFNKDTGTEYDETNSNLTTFNKDTKTDYDEDNSNTRTFNKDTGTEYEETNGNTRTFNKDTGTDYEETNRNTRTLNTQDGENTSNTPKNIRWELFSDTPQGGINGITADNDSVANNTYLTTAKKTTDDGTGSTIARTLNQTGTIGDSGGKDATTDVEERGTIADAGSKDYTTDVEERGTIADVGSKEFTNDVKETGTIGDSGTKQFTNDVEERGTVKDDGTKEYTSDTKETGTITDSGNKNVRATNLNNYIDKVVGKRNSMSYSKMLQEFRDTFLKIDEMVIKELANLFFGLWL